MNDDATRLRQYVDEGSEAAFAALVQAHLNLVYGAALRETAGDAAAAEDIAQAVFTQLARKARRLVGRPSIAGWLYLTVRHVAANARRADRHRRQREQEAQVMDELRDELSPDEAWRRVRPVLDDAIHELEEEDRAVVILRFLEDLPLREVGARIGLSENAARMRAGRALDKLRRLLERRGINSTEAGLAAALAIGAGIAAPPSLAATIVSSAVAAGAAGSTAFNLIHFMNTTQVGAVVVGTLLVVGVAVPGWQQVRLNRERAAAARWQAEAAEVTALRNEVTRLRPLDAQRRELEELRRWKEQTQPELLRLRGLAGVARRATAEAEALQARVAQLTREKAGEGDTNSPLAMMGDLMQDTMKLQVDRRMARMAATLKLTPAQVEAAREILLRQVRASVVGVRQAFAGKFDKAELDQAGRDAGNVEEQLKALLTPEQLTHYATYQREEAEHTAGLAAQGELLQLQTSVGVTPEQQDRAYAALYEVTLQQLTGGMVPPPGTGTNMMQWLSDQKVRALEPVLTPVQLEGFRQQQAIQLKAIAEMQAKMNAATPGR